MNFVDFLRTPILKSICERLLISIQSTKPSTSLIARRGLQLCNCFIYCLEEEKEDDFFLSNKWQNILKYLLDFILPIYWGMAKKIRWEVNEEIALLQYLQKYDNHTCNKSIASLGTWACDRMLLSDRIDDFGVNIMTVSLEYFWK